LNILLAEAQSIKNLKIIAITGTKGKSTSGSICCHILKSIGYKVALAGNIGISFLDCMDNLDKYDYLTLELSSYQITNMLYPVDYSIALNLFEEHLDWHHTHENYFRDKMNINNFSQNRIVNFEDDTIKKYIKVDMDYIYFNNVDGFHMAGDFICKENRQLFDTRKLRNIKGKHLFKNFNALFTVFDLENIDLNKVFLALNSFETLEHRLEIFHENKERNIVFVNDSISTIPETTIECLKTFENYDNVRLALGGFNRKQNYTDLISLINKNDKITAYLLGDTGKTLKERLNNSYFFDNFESLIREITKNIDSNTAIILSPASASYDMFKNFKERGGVFKEKVLAQLQGF
jgi:UDP-N-acetylmuramoylalanine--D-glutamate ligase